MGAIILLSSGLDSTVALAMALEEGEIDLALTVDYGQRAAVPECEHSRQIADHYRLRHQVVRLPWFADFPGCALLDASLPLPEPGREAIDRGGPEVTRSAADVWVPNRNGVLLAVAGAYADARGSDRVVVGFNREEAATFPDNGEPFLQATSAAFSFSTRRPVRAASPTSGLDKTEIVRRGMALGAPLSLVWPCYRAGPAPCRRCESCQRFLRATEAADWRVGP